MAVAVDPRSGLDDGGEWTPAFPGQRLPFPPGHELSVQHGAHRSDAVLAADPRTIEIVEQLYRDAPICTAADLMVLRQGRDTTHTAGKVAETARRLPA